MNKPNIDLDNEYRWYVIFENFLKNQQISAAIEQGAMIKVWYG